MVILKMLKLCEENFIFYITNTKYFNVLCYFVILFLIVLIFLVKNDKIINKLKKNNLSKTIIVIASGLFVGFLIFLFLWILNANAFEGCATKYNINVYLKIKNNISNVSERINNSKVIVVGDSRMEFIKDDEDIDVPFNFEFVAKSSTHIDWFTDTAVDRIEDILDEKENDEYSVVINMGVNDLNWLKEDYDEKNLSDDYFEAYKELIKKYPEVKFYLLSVNPLDEKMIKEKIPNNKRSNKSIEKYNGYLKEKTEDSDIDNLAYCDSYNTLKFKTKDGLHYTQDTNKDIINYIANGCVQF